MLLRIVVKLVSRRKVVLERFFFLRDARRDPLYHAVVALVRNSRAAAVCLWLLMHRMIHNHSYLVARVCFDVYPYC